MKASISSCSSSFLTKSFFLTFLMIYASLLWSVPKSDLPVESTTFSNISGNIWVETDGNSMDNGEGGPSDVLVFLYDNEEDTIIAQTTTLFGKYEFNGILPGKYYIRIDKTAFQFGGSLIGLQSCPGVNDANDMVDDDDNGSDTAPNDVLSSPFDLSAGDPMVNVSIEYIDFCFYTDCNELNLFAKPTCEDLLSGDVFCDISDLDNFCATMPSDSTAGIQPSPLCDGMSSSENISWLAFIGSAGTYDLTITPFDCTIGNLGQKGIQVGLYTDCSFEEVAFCSNLCSEEPINISSGFLIPGQIYYLYINGCSGNVCSYQIDITGSTVPPSLTPDDVCVFSNGGFQCQDLSYCPNSEIIIEGRGVNFTGQFEWSVTTISGGPYIGDPGPLTETNILLLNFPTVGVYEVCLNKVNNECPDQAWSGSLCRTITIDATISAPMDEDFGEAFVCEADLNDFNINVFSNEDPNGDGDFGWNAPIPEYTVGLTQGTVYTEGCSYEQQFTLSPFTPSPVEDVLVTVCEEDLPIQVDYLTFNIFTFAGASTITYNNVILQNTQDENGCDSIINLTVEKLNIFQGTILEPICTMDGIHLQFDYINDLSTEIDYLDFEWKDPLGNILPPGADPTTLLAPFDSGDGEYTLDVTINKNGVPCDYSYAVLVNVESYLPPVPTIEGPDIVCEGDSSAVYSAQGEADEMFVWTFPNDVSSAIISGSFNEILTIDWSGSAGGPVKVSGQNDCGPSNPSTVNVQIILKTTPSINLDTSVCIGNTTTIDFFGTGINVSDYTWNFDGGTIVSGSGMGPYEVFWNNAGDKVVSLITTDLNGCFSNAVEETIKVKTPLTPTEVVCLPSVGEIIFTWDIPLGVSGFEVNVLTGQSGGVFSATSFTIGGLEENETVTIELLTKPEDPICGEFVSTIISCTSLDCIPPEIELNAIGSVCVDAENVMIEATITSGETGIGMFSGPGIIDTDNGIFDPGQANIGINTILYTFTSDVAGCVGSKTISIEVFDLPIASFTQNPDTLCIDSAVDIEYTGTPNVETIVWDFDGGVGSGLLTDQQVSFDTPGTKTISLQVTKDGCVSNIASSSVVIEPELENLTIQCDTQGYDFVTFSWNPINGAPLFQIKVDNNAPFFTPNTTVTVDGLNEEQEVTIFVTSLSATTCPGSTFSSTCTTTKSPVAVEDALFGKIRIFPNPVNSILYIDGVIPENLTYDLYSILGNSVKRGFLTSKVIDLAAVSRGVYILRIMDEQSGLSKEFKVVKE